MVEFCNLGRHRRTRLPCRHRGSSDATDLELASPRLFLGRAAESKV